MSGLFKDCSSLKTLNLSNFNTIGVMDMSSIFQGCTNLEEINFNFNTINTQNMNYMFAQCSSMTSLNLTSFNSAKCNAFKDMFLDCQNLTVYLKKENNDKLISNIPDNVEVITEFDYTL